MRIVVLVTAVLLALCSGFGQSSGRQFKGEIMDSQCATMGSHDQMMKSENAKNAKDCTLKCVKAGGKYVLFDSAENSTYQLDDQDKPAEYAGQKVTVTGTYDGSSKTIHVEKIEPRS